MDNTKFIKVPTNLIYMLDCNCLKLMAILIQKESYWENKGKLEDGWFVKTISEIKKELECANTKDVRCVIQALVDSGLVSVTAYERKKMSARFRINWDKVNELNEISLYDMNEFDFEPIRKLSRKSKTTYNKNTKCTPESPQSSTICTSTIANKDNIEKIDNRDNDAMLDSGKNSVEVVSDKALPNSSQGNNPMSKIDDPCDTLKKIVCFISYDSPISKIVQSIRTKTMCANQPLIALQGKLNSIISQYKDEIATADICKELWKKLTSTLFEADYKPNNSIEQQKYIEIIQCVDRIGYAIAYVCKRKYLKDAKAIEESSNMLLVGSVSGDYKMFERYYLTWLVAKYTLDDKVSETEYCTLSKEEICNQIAAKNDYFRNSFERWKSQRNL